MYDVLHMLTPRVSGVASDLSHIDTNTKVQGFVGADELGNALKGSDVVVIPAGVPRKPGMYTCVIVCTYVCLYGI